MTCVFLNLPGLCPSTYSILFISQRNLLHRACWMSFVSLLQMLNQLFSRHENPLEIAQRMKCADMVAWMSEFMVRVGSKLFNLMDSNGSF